MSQKQTALYIRVSTLDQESGLKSQETALRDYAANHGLKNVVWYRDRVSGGTLARPAFEKLQKDVFAGKIDTILVWKLDRISRSLRDGINVLSDWCEKGIRVVSVTQQLDLSGAIGQLVAGVLLGIGQMERENLRENTKRGLQAARARGKVLGRQIRLHADDIIKLKKEGLSMSEIAVRLNATRQGLYECLRRENKSA